MVQNLTRQGDLKNLELVMEAYVQQRQPSMATKDSEPSKSDSLVNSMQLNTDEYLSLDVDEEGSIRSSPDETNDIHETLAKRLSEPAPNSFSEVSKDDEEYDLNDVWKAWQTANATGVKEDLHEQILAAEEGFRQQSEAFSKTLLEGGDLLNFREKQKKAREELMRLERDKLAAKLDAFVVSNEDKPTCEVCGCYLNQDELAWQQDSATKTCQICHVDKLREDMPPPRRIYTTPYEQRFKNRKRNDSTPRGNNDEGKRT